MIRNKHRFIKVIMPYFYIAPAALVMLCMLGFPVAYNIGVSFLDWDLRKPTRPFVGLQNYITIISDDKFVKVLVTTLIWTICGVLLQMIIGIGLALFVDSLKRLKGFVQSIILLPWIIPGVIVALMWSWMLQSDMGVINNLIQRIGITKSNILWFGDPNLALITEIFINTWKAVPFWFLMILAALQDMPKDQLESAQIDGASYPRIIRSIIIPHIKPIIAATGVITSIWTLNYFDLIWVTTQGGPMDATSTLPIYTYRLGFEFYKFSQSAAMSVLSLIIIIIVCLPYIKSMLTSIEEGAA